jgi:hypothetical protein
MIPQQAFDCMVFGPAHYDNDIFAIAGRGDMSIDHSDSSVDGMDTTVDVYEVLILQLGSFTRYNLYAPGMRLMKGQVVSCHLYRRYTQHTSYILLPTDFPFEKLPPDLRQQLMPKTTASETPTDPESFEQTIDVSPLEELDILGNNYNT